MWFWTKSRTIDEMIKISRIIDLHTEKLVEQLEALDQNKVYVCSMPGASQEDINHIKRAFNESGKKMNWTMPKIMFLNTEFKEERSVEKQ